MATRLSREIPPGLPVLAACAALIYLPPLAVRVIGHLVDVVRRGDDALAEIGDDR